MGKVKCPTCKGTGQREMNFHNLIMDNLICHTCNGTGYIWKKPTKIRAIREILDRGYGKPKGRIEEQVSHRIIRIFRAKE